jgi:hypothetical protein
VRCEDCMVFATGEAGSWGGTILLMEARTEAQKETAPREKEA